MPAHFDDSQIRELGKMWIDDGLRIHEYLGTMHGSVQSMAGGWTGKAGRAAQLVWNGVADHNIWHAIWEAGYVAQEVGKAIIGYADELQKTIKEINRAHLIEALTAVFGMVLGIASFGIAGVLSRIATLVGEIVESLVASISKLAAAAAAIGRAAAFTADSVLNAALTLGTDVLADVMGSAASHAPVVIDWAGEGINMGLGVWMGAGMGGVEQHLMDPRTTVGKQLTNLPVSTPTPSPAPVNVTLPGTSATVHNAVPGSVNLAPFDMNSVIETNHLPSSGAGIAGPHTNVPRTDAGGMGGSTPLPGNVLPAAGGPGASSGSGRPGATGPGVTTPSSPGKQVMAGGGEQAPPNQIRGNVAPATGTPQAYLDGPPRGAGAVPGKTGLAPSVPHEGPTGGKGTTTGGPGVRNDLPPAATAPSEAGGTGTLPPNTATSHGGGVRGEALPNNATSHGPGGGRVTAGSGTTVSPHEPENAHAGPAGTGAQGRGTVQSSTGGSRTPTDPAVVNGDRAPAGTGPGTTTRPGSPEVSGGTRLNSDAPNTRGTTSPETSAGARPNNDAPQNTRGTAASSDGGRSRATAGTPAPDPVTGAKPAAGGRNQGAQPSSEHTEPNGGTRSQTSAESGVFGGPESRQGSAASQAPGPQAVKQPDLGVGATTGEARDTTVHGAATGAGDASVHGRTSGADDTSVHGQTSSADDTSVHGTGTHPGADAGTPPARDDAAYGSPGHRPADAPAFDPDGAAKAEQWNAFAKAHTERNAPLVEAEARLELRTEELDAAWERGFVRFTERDALGLSDLARDSHEVIHAKFKWRSHITQAFRDQIEKSGSVPTDALNKIVQDAGNKAHKYLEWSDQATKFTSRFKAEVSDFRTSGLDYRKELAEFDTAPSDYTYDARLKTYVKNDSKTYGYPSADGEGPVVKPKGGTGQADAADIDVFVEYKSRSDGPIDHFRDKSDDFNQVEQYFIGKKEEFNEVFGRYLQDGEQTTLSPSTKHQLDAVTNGMGDDLEAIAVRERRIQVSTEKEFDDVVKWQARGNRGRDALSDEFVSRVRLEFKRDLRTQHDLIYENGFGDGTPNRLWDAATTRAIDDLPGRIEREKFIRATLSDETVHAENHLAGLDESQFNTLGQEGRQRVLGEYLDTVRDIAGAHFSDQLNSGRTSSESILSGWTGRRDDVRSTLPRTVRHEGELQGVVTDAAFDFHKIVGHPDSVEAFQLHEDTIGRLGNDFRTERVVEYDHLYASDQHKTDVWLAHESRHDDGFQFMLDDLRREDTRPVTLTGHDDPAAPATNGNGNGNGNAAAVEKPPAGVETTASAATTGDAGPLLPPRDSGGHARPAPTGDATAAHGGPARADVETSAPHQEQVTVGRDTVGAPGSSHGQGSGTTHTGGRDRSTVSPEQKQVRPAPKTVDLPHAVAEWLSNHSNHTFGRAEIETAHQDLLHQGPPGFSDMPLDTQAAEVGRTLEQAASRVVRAASDMLLQQTGVYPDGSEVRQARQELSEHFGVSFGQLPDDRQSVFVAAHVRDQRALVHMVVGRVGTGIVDASHVSSSLREIIGERGLKYVLLPRQDRADILTDRVLETLRATSGADQVRADLTTQQSAGTVQANHGAPAVTEGDRSSTSAVSGEDEHGTSHDVLTQTDAVATPEERQKASEDGAAAVGQVPASVPDLSQSQPHDAPSTTQDRGHSAVADRSATVGLVDASGAAGSVAVPVRSDELAEVLTGLRDTFGVFNEDGVPGWGVWKEPVAGVAGTAPALTESGLGEAGRGVRQFFADKFGQLLHGDRNRGGLRVPANPEAPGEVPVGKLSDRDISRLRLNRAGDGVTTGVLSLHNAQDWAARRTHWSNYHGAEGHYASLQPGALVSRRQPAPWSGTGRPVYYVTAHGEYDKARSYLLSGRKKIIDAHGLSRILAHDPVFTELSKQPVDVVLAICEAGLTGERSMAQQLADDLGVTVHAPNGEVALESSVLHGTTLLTVYSQDTEAGTFTTFTPRTAAATTHTTTSSSSTAPASGTAAAPVLREVPVPDHLLTTRDWADTAATGGVVHEDFDDLRFTAGLLNERGVPLPDLLGDGGVGKKDVRHTSGATGRNSTVRDPGQRDAPQDSVPTVSVVSEKPRRRPARLLLDDRPRVVRDYVIARKDGAPAGGVFRRATPMLLSDHEAAAQVTSGRVTDPTRLVTVVQGVATDDHPELHVSADGTLAMSTKDEAQEAFATQGAFARASAALKAAGSGAKLTLDTGVALTFTHNGVARTLHPVRPEFTERPPDVCRDLARDLIGGMPDHLVYRDRGGRTGLGPMRATDGLKVSEMHYLAQAVIDVAEDRRRSATTPDVLWAARKTVRQADATDPRTPLPGQSYGAYLGPAQPYRPERQILRNTATQIGINEHAWAQVGEAYLSQSIGNRGPDGAFELEDHAGAFHPVTNPFGYHYATVVLGSEDGKTQVTLENYNRQGVAGRAFKQAVERNLEQLGDQLEVVRDSFAGAKDHNPLAAAGFDAAAALIQLRDARAELATAQSGAAADAVGPAQTSVDSAALAAERKLRAFSSRQGHLTTPGNLWHMRFVSRQHSTFHDQLAGLREQDAPGIVVNPLTAVVVGAHGDIVEPSRWIDFAPGAGRLAEGDRRKIAYVAHRVARVGLWNFRNGRALPSVQVSAGGNGAASVVVPHRERLARKQADTRIETLTDVFRQELRRSLQDLQSDGDGHEGTVLDAGRFTITSRNRGRAFPEGSRPTLDVPADVLRRRAVFELDMHPVGADQPSALTRTLESLGLGSPVTPRRVSRQLSPTSRTPVDMSFLSPDHMAFGERLAVTTARASQAELTDMRQDVTSGAAAGDAVSAQHSATTGSQQSAPERLPVSGERNAADARLLHSGVLKALARLDPTGSLEPPTERGVADLYEEMADTYKRWHPSHAQAERIAIRWQSGEWPGLLGGAQVPSFDPALTSLALRDVFTDSVTTTGAGRAAEARRVKLARFADNVLLSGGESERPRVMIRRPARPFETSRADERYDSVEHVTREFRQALAGAAEKRGAVPDDIVVEQGLLGHGPVSEHAGPDDVFLDLLLEQAGDPVQTSGGSGSGAMAGSSSETARIAPSDAGLHTHTFHPVRRQQESWPAGAESFTRWYGNVTEGSHHLALSEIALRARLDELAALAGEGGFEDHTGEILSHPTASAAATVLRRIDAAIGHIDDAQERHLVSAVVNDLLLAASLVPVRYAGTEATRHIERMVQLVTPDRAGQVLRQLAASLEARVDPFRAEGSLLAHAGHTNHDTLPQRLAKFGLMALEPGPRGLLLHDSLFSRLLDSPTVLAESLLANNRHQRQLFMTTCGLTTANAEVREKVPTLAGLLVVGRGVTSELEQILTQSRPDFDSRTDRLGGTRTLGDLLRSRADAAVQGFRSIEARAHALLDEDAQGEELRRSLDLLTEEWDRLMQKLAGVIPVGDTVPVLTPVDVRSGLAALAGSLLVPVVLPDRLPRRIMGTNANEYRFVLSEQLSRDPRETNRGDLISQSTDSVSIGKAIRDHGVETLWQRLHLHNGIHVHIPRPEGVLGHLTPVGHLLYLRAVSTDGRKQFQLFDPARSDYRYMSPAMFTKWAESADADMGSSFAEMDTPVVVPPVRTGTASVNQPLPQRAGHGAQQQGPGPVHSNTQAGGVQESLDRLTGHSFSVQLVGDDGALAMFELRPEVQASGDVARQRRRQPVLPADGMTLSAGETARARRKHATPGDLGDIEAGEVSHAPRHQEPGEQVRQEQQPPATETSGSTSRRRLPPTPQVAAPSTRTAMDTRRPRPLPVPPGSLDAGLAQTSSASGPSTHATDPAPAPSQVSTVADEQDAIAPRTTRDAGEQLPTPPRTSAATATGGASESGLRDASARPLRYRERLALAKRVWEEPVTREVRSLEDRLVAAGPGARSLVMGVAPGEQLWAWNLNGTVSWREHGTGLATQAPQTAAGQVTSIDLGPQGMLIHPHPLLGEFGASTTNFCELTLGADLKHVV